MSRPRRFAAIAGAIALGCSAWLAPGVAAAATEVPFELVNDHVFVDVMLDGTGPYHFVLDSGAPFGLLDRAVAGELALDVRPRARVGGVGDTEAEAGEATVRIARIGETVLPQARFVVTDLHGTIGEAEGRPIDGVLGRDLLRQVATTFDYAARTIVFGADLDALQRAGATFVPMRLAGGIPQIACRIATFSAPCNVDTGSRLPVTVTAPFAAAHPQIVPHTRSALGVDGFGLGGPAFGRLGRLASLAFGGFVIRDAVCDFSTQRRGAFADPELGANIGGGILRRFAVTFDYAHRRIGFLKNAEFARPEPFDRSGLFLVGHLPGRSDGIGILDVRPGTPAARAAITPADRIVAVDGHAVGAADVPAIRRRLMADVATTVTLELERAGTIRDVALDLEDYVGDATASPASAAWRSDGRHGRYGR